jgi:tRNA1(Val) A37 N6-methylase TrmN6
MPEHNVAGLGDVLIELQAGLGMAQQLGELGLAVLDRLTAQVATVELQQKAYRKTRRSSRR